MVSTFGNNIVSAFTNGTSVKAIYNYGQLVWPSSEPTPVNHYIQWTPTDVTGVFSLSGVYYDFQDYPDGIFSDFHGEAVITSGAFASQDQIATLETKVDVIQNSAFVDCSGLLSARIYSCTTIGDSAFRWCGALSWIYAECNYIGTYGFQGAAAKYIYLPYCSQIGGAAFAGGKSGKYVTLGYQGLVSGAGAFNNYSIYELNVPAWLESSYEDSGWAQNMQGYPNVLNIKGFHYFSCPGYYSSYNKGGGLTSSEFNNVSNISSIITDAVGVDESCFLGSTSVQEVYLPHCIEIETDAFRGCISLETVQIPEIVHIRSHAFQGCTSLSLLNLYSCYTIDAFAFSGCTSLYKIQLSTSGCTLSDSTVFSGCINLTSILVPASLVSYYKTSNVWSYFSDIIVGY